MFKANVILVDIIVARIAGRPIGNSSIDFSISYQPTLTPSSTQMNVYFSKNNITNYLETSLPVPQNGTYYFKFHYNFNGEDAIYESLSRYWSANELVPTTVYTPLLADYTYFALIISIACLLVGIGIPIHRRFQ